MDKVKYQQASRKPAAAHYASGFNFKGKAVIGENLGVPDTAKLKEIIARNCGHQYVFTIHFRKL